MKINDGDMIVLGFIVGLIVFLACKVFGVF